MVSKKLPRGWKVVELGKMMKRIKDPVRLLPSEMYREIGIRSHGKGIFHKEEQSGRSIGNKSVFWVKPDCLIVNIVFAWEQAVAKTTIKEKGMIASHRFPMYKPLTDVLDLDYILYYFKTPYGRHLLELASPGGAGRNKTLGQEEFLRLNIPLPPLCEQRQIAKILTACDETIAINERLITELQKRKKGLMQHLLSGKVHFSRQEKKWETVRLQDIFQRVIRKVGANKVEHVLSITATVGFVDQREKFGKVIAGKNLANYVLLRKGEFAYNKGNSNSYPQGCIYLLEEFSDGAVPNVYFSFTAKPYAQVDNCFYKYYFESGALNQQLEKYISSSVRGNGLFNIAFKDFFSVKVLYPPVAAQRKIAEILEACDKEINLQRKKLELLKQQRKGLMQKLLTGQIRVKV